MWNEVCKKIFIEFADKLNDKGIRYFVLRNYKNLPEQNLGKDVDIVVDPKRVKDARQILKLIFKRNGLKYYDEAIFNTMYCMHGMGNGTGIHIDLIGGYQTKGYEIFTFDELYAHAVEYKNFYVLDELYDGVMLLIYKIFGYKKPELKEKYREEIFDCYQKYAIKFEAEISKVLGDNFGNQIAKLISEKHFDEIIEESREINRRLKNAARQKSFIKTAKGRIHYLWQKFDRVVLRYRKYKRTFAVLAPDGTGKTTFIDTLIDKLNYYYVSDPEDNKFHLYHFRPTIFPNLGEVGEKAGVMEQDKDFTNPHRQKAANPISSFFRIAYYTLDYILGWQKCVRRDVRMDRYSIFDRYSYDLIVDPRRTRLNLPKGLRKFFVWLTPRPGVVFILKADADTIYERKQELTKEEIERQLEEYDLLAKTNKRFKTIDAKKTPDEMTDEALAIIFEKYAK